MVAARHYAWRLAPSAMLLGIVGAAAVQFSGGAPLALSTAAIACGALCVTPRRAPLFVASLAAYSLILALAFGSQLDLALRSPPGTWRLVLLVDAALAAVVVLFALRRGVRP